MQTEARIALIALKMSFVFLTACQADEDKAKDLPKVFALSYDTQATSGLSIGSDEISGEGTLSFYQGIRPEAQSSVNVSLSLSLPENGGLEILTFAKPDLSDALTLSVYRDPAGVHLKVPSSEGELIRDLQLEDLDRAFLLSFDIHNQENGAKSHVLAWQNDRNPPSDAAAYILDEETIVSGQGTVLALRLKSAKVADLKLAEPKSEDE